MLKKLFILIITLALLEFLLEGAGYMLTLKHRGELKRRLLSSRSSDVKIICLGDSTTFGLESSYGNSYPQQLERLLNTEIKGRKFVVYNLGVVGQNSFQVKEALRENILNYNPEYIVVLAGVNNRWNLSGRECRIGDDLQLRPRNKMLVMFDTLRLVKLVRLIVVNVKYKLFLHSAFSGARHSIIPPANKVNRMDEKLIREIPGIRQDIEKNNLSPAFTRVEVALKENPESADLHNLLGKIYYLRYDYKKAVEKYDRALVLRPGDRSFLHGEAVSYRESGNMEKALEVFGLIAKLYPEDKSLRMDFRHTFLNSKGKLALSDREAKIMDYWLRQDLSRIASIAAKYKKKLILLTNPTLNWQDEIRRSISQAFQVPLIDIYSLFRKLDNVSEYLGATGGHPNDKGYSLMAREVFNLIKQDLR